MDALDAFFRFFGADLGAALDCVGDASRDAGPPRPAAARKSSTRSSSSAMFPNRATSGIAEASVCPYLVVIKTLSLAFCLS
jgi:hypothetical protein